MRFDDRIKTVLEHPVASDRDRAVRWRQLVDLLSRARPDSDPDLVARALDMAHRDRETVPDDVRAATARSIAGRPVDARLVALFAADRLAVAAPLLAAANLDDEGRTQVAAVASDEVRNLFFALDGSPLPEVTEPLELTKKADNEPPSISEMVARIERRRKADVHFASIDPPVDTFTPDPPVFSSPIPSPNETIPPEAPADVTEAEAVAPEPAQAVDRPTGQARDEEPTLFRWESDPAGAIAWVDGAPRAALIGRALAGHPGEALLHEDSRRLLVRRVPFVDLPMAGSEPFSGDWRVSGAPAFSTAEGRFIGYRGIARRIDLAPAPATGRPPRRHAEDADSLRELVHEIKTPLNAIIGFAEIIDGQFLGPAHRNYRLRAAGIVSQARSLLAAVEDLDLAAKLQAGRKGGAQSGTEFSELFPRIAEQMNSLGAARGIGLVYRLEGEFTRCALEPELAERMVRRFLGAVIDAAADGEALSVLVSPHAGRCGVSVNRPSSLRDVPEGTIFDPSFGHGDEATIGLGFTFRLVRGLAQSVGGDFKLDEERFVLLLPAHR